MEKEKQKELILSNSKVCKRCKQSYDPNSNTSSSCRFHTSFFVCRRHDDQKRYSFIYQFHLSFFRAPIFIHNPIKFPFFPLPSEKKRVNSRYDHHVLVSGFQDFDLMSCFVTFFHGLLICHVQMTYHFAFRAICVHLPDTGHAEACDFILALPNNFFCYHFFVHTNNLRTRHKVSYLSLFVFC